MAIAIMFNPIYKIKILEFYSPIICRFEALNEIEKIHGICYIEEESILPRTSNSRRTAKDIF